jgi:DNA-directed RNA polymerase alpha subunit
MGQNSVATWAEDDDTPIETLDLSVRVYNCLKRSNISTVRRRASSWTPGSVR